MAQPNILVVPPLWQCVQPGPIAEPPGRPATAPAHPAAAAAALPRRTRTEAVAGGGSGHARPAGCGHDTAGAAGV